MTFFKIYLFLWIFLVGTLQAKEIRFARYLDIRETRDSVIIKVKKVNSKRDTPLKYVILRQAKKIIIPDGGSLAFPLQRTGISNVFHVSLLRELRLLDRVVCMSNMNYLKSEELKQELKRFNIREVSSPTGINIELVLSIAPQVFFINIPGSIYDPDEAFRQFGVPYIVSGEWLEESLLGRSEWVKFFACFFDELPHARQWFDQVAVEYQSEIRKMEKGNPTRLLWGSVFSGQVWLAGNQSYVAQFMREAGIDFMACLYPVQTQQVGLETFIELFKQADIFVYSGEMNSLDDLLQLEPRLQKITGFKQKRIYSLKSTYHEYGILYPQRIMNDLHQMKQGRLKDGYFFKTLQ